MDTFAKSFIPVLIIVLIGMLTLFINYDVAFAIILIGLYLNFIISLLYVLNEDEKDIKCQQKQK